MATILVSGLINLETNLRIEQFPLDYFPVTYPFHGVRSHISGVGFNIAKALSTLGDDVRLLSLVGVDPVGKMALEEITDLGVDCRYILPCLIETAQSVILYDPLGRRQIHVDLKNIQDQQYPAELFSEAISGSELAVLCTINFSCPLLSYAIRAGVPIATDVHTLGSLDAVYEQDFLEASKILFMSDELLPDHPETFARQVLNRFGVEILVIGMGSHGALMAVRKDGFLGRFPAVYTRPVVNTIGAGDALFSCFIHEYLASNGDPYLAIQKAMVFASYKTGETGAARGFLTQNELNELCEVIDKQK